MDTPRRASARRDHLSVTTAAILWGTVGIAGRTLQDTAAFHPLTVGWYRPGRNGWVLQERAPG